MRRITFLSLLAFFVFVLPVPRLGWLGVMNNVSGWYWCTSPSNCLHEQAHLIDKQAGWISKTDEYSEALFRYLVYRSEMGEPEYSIMALLGYSMPEIYARVYAIFGGNVPDTLLSFYPASRPPRLVIELPKGALNIP